MRALLLSAAVVLLGCPKPTPITVEPAPSASGPPAKPSAAPSVSASPSASASTEPPFDGYRVVSKDGALTAKWEAAKIEIVDTKTGAPVSTITSTMALAGVLFTPDGKGIFVAHENAPPWFYPDLRAPTKSIGFELPKGIAVEADRGAAMLQVSDDGKLLLGRCATIQVCLWTVNTGAGKLWQQPGPGDELESLAFEPGGKRVTVKTTKGTVYRLEVPALKLVP